ncbi:MAG: hypothetical protein ABR863_03830 [Roseiarcus sp.]|jgi:hypothetical protein
MSNALRLEVDKTAFHLDAASARRQFWLSLGVGLAVLAAAATIATQSSRAAPDAPCACGSQVRAPAFVASPVAIAELRRAMTAAARKSAN